jgi:hypothetical protein
MNRIHLKNRIVNLWEIIIKIILIFLGVFFRATLIISLIISLLVTFYTIFELSSYNFCFSKHCFASFLYAFNWCEKYYVASFTACSIFYALSNYEQSLQSKIYLNHIKPNIDKLYSRLPEIKEKNITMYDYFLINGEQLIYDIYKKQSRFRPYFTSDDLQKNFARHITPKIANFESAEHTQNQSDTIKVPYEDLENKPQALDSFLKIAPALFCNYQNDNEFIENIKKLYIDSIPELRTIS